MKAVLDEERILKVGIAPAGLKFEQLQMGRSIVRLKLVAEAADAIVEMDGESLGARESW
jgi:hypothetical protein